MATIFRDPVITLQQPKPDCRSARESFPPGRRSLALLLAVALPIGQSVGHDSPNYFKDIDSPIARDRQRINDLPRQLDRAFPAGRNEVYGWDRPKDRKWDSPIARDRQRVNDLPRQLEKHPFNETDWPLADVRDSPIARDRQHNNDLQNQLATYQFNEEDWPLADRVDSPLTREQRPTTNDLPRRLQVTLPELQYDWPLPERVDSPLARDRQRVNDLPRQVETHPFGQTDWPLAEPIRTTPQGWTVSLALPPTTLPFDQTDWPLPQRRESARDRPEVNSLALRTATYPAAQYDWPLPERIDSPLARDRQRINDLGRQTFVRLPTQPYDWPLPRPGRPAPAEYFYANVVPINTPVVVVGAPFSQLNWPLAATMLQALIDNIPANLLPINVGPVPPPTPKHKSGVERLRVSTIAKIDRALAMNLIDSAVVRENLEELAARLRRVDQPSSTAYAYDSIAQIPEAMLLRDSGWSMTEIYALVDDVVAEREDEEALLMLLRSQL